MQLGGWMYQMSSFGRTAATVLAEGLGSLKLPDWLTVVREPEGASCMTMHSAS